MAILTNEFLNALLKDVNHVQKDVQSARKYEEQIKFHTVTERETRNLSPYYWHYLKNWPETILPDDKSLTFKGLFTLPVPTVEVVDESFQELFRVFEAHDRFIQFDFQNPDTEKEYKQYLTKIPLIGDLWSWFKSEGFRLMKTAPNTLLVVDLPTEQTTEQPEPYFTTHGIENVIKIFNQPDGVCEWVMFWTIPQKRVVIIDGFAYRVYDKPEQQPDFVLVAEVEHGLGFCPARQFWTDNAEGSHVNKEGPINKSLGSLDYMLFEMISERYLDLFSAYPIISVYEQKCDYLDEDGFMCDGRGKLELTYETDAGELKTKTKPCPNCSNKKLVGPGTVLTAPARADAADPDLLQGIFIQEADTDALSSMAKKIAILQSNFKRRTVGIDTATPENEQAKNVFQVGQQLESKHAVLMRLAANLQKAAQFLVDTIGVIRYGDQYEGGEVNLGTEFFIKTVEQLQNEYERDKKSGIPFFELANVRKMIFRTKYKNNPELLSKIELLNALEPYPDLTIDEVIKLKREMALVISVEDMVLKVNFNQYITRFESEFVPLGDFMPQATLEEKTQIIGAQLREWTAQDVQRQQEQAQAAFEAQAAAGMNQPAVESEEFSQTTNENE